MATPFSDKIRIRLKAYDFRLLDQSTRPPTMAELTADPAAAETPVDLTIGGERYLSMVLPLHASGGASLGLMYVGVEYDEIVMEQRAAQRAGQQAEFVRQQREIAHIRSYIDRFKTHASKARQAQSRMKALERMELIAPAHVDTPFSFEFRDPAKIPNPLLTLDPEYFDNFSI